MPEIQDADLANALRLRFNIRVPFGLELAQTIVGVIDVDSVSARLSSRGYPRDCMGVIVSPGGGVGTNSQCVIRGTAGVGKVFEVSHAMVRKASANAVDINVSRGATIEGIASANTLRTYLDQRLADADPDIELGQSQPLTANIDGDAVGSFFLSGQDTLLVPLGFILAK